MVASEAQGTVMRIFCYQVIWGCLFFISLASAQQREYFLPKPTVQKYAVILAGTAAEEKYANQIHRWALRLHDILTNDYGYGPEQIVLLMGQVDPDDARISGSCRREIIQDKLRVLREVLQPGDQVFLFLLGHGTSNDEEAKFVITGPDITGQEFASILETLSEQDIVLVNTTSSSFPFCTALTGPGRVIVSATRSRAEKYDTIFAQYFIAALDGHASDRDKNRRVSIWEAFGFAAKSVEKWYADQNRIPTEHAMLDDNGDGIFSIESNSVKDDGRLAQIAYLDLIPAESTGDEIPAGVDVTMIRDLTAKARELERSVFLLRNRKAELPQESYQKEMEVLLIELARISRKLRNMTPAQGH